MGQISPLFLARRTFGQSYYYYDADANPDRRGPLKVLVIFTQYLRPVQHILQIFRLMAPFLVLVYLDLGFTFRLADIQVAESKS